MVGEAEGKHNLQCSDEESDYSSSTEDFVTVSSVTGGKRKPQVISFRPHHVHDYSDCSSTIDLSGEEDQEVQLGGTQDQGAVCQTTVHRLMDEFSVWDNVDCLLRDISSTSKEKASPLIFKKAKLVEKEEVPDVPSTGVASTCNLKKIPVSTRLPPYTIIREDLFPGAVFDTHCHLDFIFRRLPACQESPSERTKRENWLGTSLQLDNLDLGDSFRGCVANFCDPRDWSIRRGEDMIRRVARDSRVFLAVGCHPHFADHLGGRELSGLERLLTSLRGRVVALGECGLDYSRKNIVSVEQQKRVFRSQLKLALKLHLPLVLHIREAEEDGYVALAEANVPVTWPIHRHCFNGSLDEAQAWLTRYPCSRLGVTGLLTHHHAVNLHEVVRNVPLDKLLLETDAPYFLPRQVLERDQPALPGHVVHVAAQVAALKGVPLADVLRSNLEGVEAVYNVPAIQEVEVPVTRAKLLQEKIEVTVTRAMLIKD